MLKINEIYQSIQGESTYVGLPCVFVRLTGCDLRCSFCDTEYAFYKGEKIPLEQVLQKIESYGCNLVEVTGGEPLLQKNVYRLFDLLLEKNYQVLLETGGHISVEKVPKQIVKIVDVKTPSSKMSHKNFFQNLNLIDEKDELKFVIGSRDDYSWAKELLERNETKGKVLFSPVWNQLQPEILVAWILEDELSVRFQLQMHKIIWSAQTKGV